MIPIPIPPPLPALMTVVKYSILIALLFMGAVGAYLVWLDRAPIVTYGHAGHVEIKQGHLLLYLDAVRQRDCPAVIYRQITGCSDVPMPLSPTPVTVPVGERVPSIAIPLSDMTLAPPNICVLWSAAEGYCNPIQKFIGIPIRSESWPIIFSPPSNDGLNDGYPY